MRKIVSKDTEEKRKKRNGWIIGIILIAVMLFSVLGYSFGGGEKNSSTKITYNGFEFLKQNDFWVLEKDNSYFIFIYNPEQIDKISSKLNSLENYKNKPLYIFSEDSEAELEIYRNLFYQNQIVQRFQKACPEGEKCGENIPAKTCDDNFIIIKESEKSEIIQENNCVFILGETGNLTKSSDEFLFKILGITQ